MRIGNMQQFTEHHHYYTFRHFTLSELDRKMIVNIYQPLVGAFAMAIYDLLYQQVSADRTGYSKLELQIKLFLTLGLDLNERHKQLFVQATSKLEAVGLLQTARFISPPVDDYVYEYEILRPLSPEQFFANPHLTLMLRDKMGKFVFSAVHEMFFVPIDERIAPHIESVERESLTMPFYAIFKLDPSTVDHNLQHTIDQLTPQRPQTVRQQFETATIQFGELIRRFPLTHPRRKFVERMKDDEAQFEQLNYVAYKYGLDEGDLARLLDEDDVFAAYGELNYDVLDERGSQIARQSRKRDRDRSVVMSRMKADDPAKREQVTVAEQFFLPVPASLREKMSVQEYNNRLRNEPYTRFVNLFTPGAVPEWIMSILQVIDLDYRLHEEVINVLIHYVLGTGTDAQRITRGYVDAVASNMLVKNIDTYEKAIHYVQEQLKADHQKNVRERKGGNAATERRRSPASSSTTRRRPLAIVEEAPQGPTISDAELEELRRLAQKLDGK